MRYVAVKLNTLLATAKFFCVLLPAVPRYTTRNYDAANFRLTVRSQPGLLYTGLSRTSLGLLGFGIVSLILLSNCYWCLTV